MQVREDYMQTEVGVIPDDWAVSKVEEVAKVVDSLHQTPSFSAEGYPMVRVTDIKTGNLNLNSALRVNEKVFVEFTKNYKPKRDDIVLSRVGSYGVSSFVETDEQFCMGQNTVVIQSIVPARYLYYVLNSRGVRQQIDDGSYGSGYKSLSLKNIKELLVPTPPTANEQRAIATALSDVDALLAAQDKLITKKRDIKKAAMQQLLSGTQRLPGFTGEWEVKRLGDLLEYEQPTKYLVNDSEYSDANDVPVLTAGKTFILGYTHESHGVFNNLPVIIFDDFTTANKYVTFPFKAKSSAMKMLKPRDSTVNLRLVFEMMQLIKFQLRDHKRYWISEYQNLEIKVPSPKEQTAIATILSGMDADLAALEQQRDKTRAIKQGMMQELLTGKTRLILKEKNHD